MWRLTASAYFNHPDLTDIPMSMVYFYVCLTVLITCRMRRRVHGEAWGVPSEPWAVMRRPFTAVSVS